MHMEERLIPPHSFSLEIDPNPTLTVNEGDAVFIVCSPVGTNPVMLLENGMDANFPFNDNEDERTFNLGAAMRINNGNIYQCASGDAVSDSTTLFVQCEFKEIQHSPTHPTHIIRNTPPTLQHPHRVLLAKWTFSSSFILSTSLEFV